MTRKLASLIACISHTLVLFTSPGFAADVTAERLLNAAREPHNWLMNNKTYDSHRYSALDGINRTNVGQLKVLFSVPLGGVQGGGNYIAAQYGSPLVDDGMMYLPDGWGRIYKIDLRSGKSGHVVWAADPQSSNIDSWLQGKRGLALYGDSVIATTPDGQVHWLKAETGERLNSVQVDDPRTGYTIVTPPLIVNEMLIIGGAGADRGARSHIDALDARTGKPLWHTYLPQAPGEPGSDASKTATSWRNGGGSFRQTGSYDPELNVSVWGTSGPEATLDSSQRPGANPSANSALALDVKTGDVKWLYQYTPDQYGGVSENGSQVLIDAVIGGTRHKLVSHFSPNGSHYAIDRTTGRPVTVAPYMQESGAASRGEAREVKPSRYAGLPNDILAFPETGCPMMRTPLLVPMTFSDRTGSSYGAWSGGCATGAGEAPDGYAGQDNIGGGIAAVDPRTGARIAERVLDFPPHTALFSTAGGLVFVPTADGAFSALNDETLEPLWTFKLASLAAVPPVTYAVNGKQYLAVVVGGNAFANEFSSQPKFMMGVQSLYVLVVFGIP